MPSAPTTPPSAGCAAAGSGRASAAGCTRTRDSSRGSDPGTCADAPPCSPVCTMTPSCHTSARPGCSACRCRRRWTRASPSPGADPLPPAARGRRTTSNRRFTSATTTRPMSCRWRACRCLREPGRCSTAARSCHPTRHWRSPMPRCSAGSPPSSRCRRSRCAAAVGRACRSPGSSSSGPIRAAVAGSSRRPGGGCWRPGCPVPSCRSASPMNAARSGRRWTCGSAITGRSARPTGRASTTSPARCSPRSSARTGSATVTGSRWCAGFHTSPLPCSRAASRARRARLLREPACFRQGCPE
jgi:hypothetical protein